jgi:O-antigen/teichoic acid export membrane protein
MVPGRGDGVAQAFRGSPSAAFNPLCSFEKTVLANSFGRVAAAKAAALMTGSTYISYGLGIVVSALIARDLGPADYGRYAYVVWMSGVLVVIACAAFNTTAIRFISECMGRDDPVQARAVHHRIRSVLWIGIAATAAGFVAMTLVDPPSGWSGMIGWFVAATLTSFGIKAAYLFDTSVAKGWGRFTVEAYSMIGVTLLNAIGVCALAWRHSGLEAYLVMFSLTSLAYFVAGASLLRRAGISPSAGAIPAALRAQMRHHSLWTLVLGVSAVLGNRSFETYLLGRGFGSADVGFFAIASALVRGAIDIFTVGLSTVLMPAMAQAIGRHDHARVNLILSESMRYFVFVGLFLGGVGCLLATPIITLMYGHKYDAVVPLFRMLLLVGAATASEGAFGALLTTTDRQTVRATIALGSIVVSATTAFTLVPRFGLEGAVASAIISRALYFATLIVVIARGWKVSWPVARMARLALAAAMALVLAVPASVMLRNPWVDAIDAGVYAVAFLVLSVKLGAWSAEDATMALRLLERIPRIPSRWTRAIERWRDARA